MRWRFAVRKAKGRIASPGRWLPGPGTESVAYVDASGANPRFVATDERGSVVADYDKASIQTYRYGPHGEPDSGGSPDRLGYAGGVDVAELGLVIMGARVYSPAMGRFLQTDPIGIAGGANVYDYAGGDPVNRVDPSGTCKTQVVQDSITYMIGWTASGGDTNCHPDEEFYAKARAAITEYQKNNVVVIGITKPSPAPGTLTFGPDGASSVNGAGNEPGSSAARPTFQQALGRIHKEDHEQVCSLVNGALGYPATVGASLAYAASKAASTRLGALLVAEIFAAPTLLAVGVEAMERWAGSGCVK